LIAPLVGAGVEDALLGQPGGNLTSHVT